MHYAAARESGDADRFDAVSVEGSVLSVCGLGVEIDDRLGALNIGARVAIDRQGAPLVAETVGLKPGSAICLPFGAMTGVRRGARARFLIGRTSVRPSHAWLGRVVNGLAEPIDGLGSLPPGERLMPLRARPIPPPMRARLGPRLDFRIKALDAFAMAREGQRLGIFSASGLGKSTLLAMIAANADCDVAVVALIGERGREVREFIEDSLGASGLKRSVVVAATSDEPALMRREAAFLAMTAAEYFRDRGLRVLCVLDSLTRVASAQREIGLAAGEPPTLKGYTPSVFSLLPTLLERAGPGFEGGGTVTGVFSVLVEGDDHDEPIADAARATLDGHIVLDRRIAERGRYPAVDILKSLSRAMSGAATPEEGEIVARARRHASVFEDMREMIRIGAYRSGASAEVDAAIEVNRRLEEFLNQGAHETCAAKETMRTLSALLAEVDRS